MFTFQSSVLFFLSQCNEYFLVTYTDYKSEHTSVPFTVSLSTVAVRNVLVWADILCASCCA